MNERAIVNIRYLVSYSAAGIILCTKLYIIMHFIEVSKSPMYLRWRPCCLIVYNTTEIRAGARGI